MKQYVIYVSYFLVLAASGATVSTNPLSKALSVIEDIQSKVITAGESSQQIYAEYAEWCEDRSRELHYEIKTAKAELEQLNAVVDSEAAAAQVLDTKITDLADDVARSNAELQKGIDIRKKDEARFATEEQEMMNIIDTVARASTIVQKGMNGDSSLVQVKNANTLADVFNILEQAAALSSDDAGTLKSLLQDDDTEFELDDEPNAPAAAVYEGKSSGVVQTLQSLHDKTTAQLASLRNDERNAKNNFALKKQSLTDAIKFASQDLNDAKKAHAASEERTAAAQGEIAVTSADLKDDVKSLSMLHHDCMERATAFEEEAKSRKDELDALAQAKSALEETTAGAASQTYVQASSEDSQGLNFVQVETQEISRASRVVHILRHMALAQSTNKRILRLLSHVEATVRAGGEQEDIFSKVRDLISDMVDRLQEQAGKEATHKVYCDKEIGHTQEHRSDKEEDIDQITTKIDVAKANSVKLKDEAVVLQSSLAVLAKQKAEMDVLRQAEKSAFDKAHADMESAVDGVRLALKVLRDYYGAPDKAHEAELGASSGLVGLLEVVDSDFSKGSAALVINEERAVANYEAEDAEISIAKGSKETDLKYKVQAASALDKITADFANDLQGENEQLDSILEYQKQIEHKCVKTAEGYTERKAQREAEMDGLKQALQALEGEAFIQESTEQQTVQQHAF